ncbi:hypothetical protein SK128_003492 [Halocaridina rubra]|uniref:Peptidase M14 domain-containing protein n=1 Tax=Halocaridina rubra TaxID=373956 RepID=A0AAN9A1R7_HALRR
MPVTHLTTDSAHAREWISPAVATYIAQQLSLAGSQFLKLVTVIVVPLTNPDGYEYTHTTDRFWRKNRRRNIDPSGCVGIDLNRNWNISWGNLDGTSNDPCSFQYCGDSAFSEPETRAIRNLTAIFLQKLSAYISLHSYGQLVLHPWGHTDKKPPEYKKLMSMGKKLLRALNNNSHSGYMAGQSSWVLYRSTGTSDDYMYNLGVPYTYTVELPNTDSFELPTSEILPTAEHVWEAFVCFVGEVIGTPRAKSFCSKRIVTAINDYNVTISSWVDKGVPLAEAKTRVLNDYKKKLADK